MKKYRKDLYGDPYGEEPPGFVRRWVRVRIERGAPESSLDPVNAVTPLGRAAGAAALLVTAYFIYTGKAISPVLIAVLVVLWLYMLFALYVVVRRGDFYTILTQERLRYHDMKTHDVGTSDNPGADPKPESEP